MKNLNKKWVLVPNSVFNTNKNDCLDINELFLFSWLYRWRAYDNVYITNLNILNEFQMLKFDNSIKKNKRYIADLIRMLEKKKYIKTNIKNKYTDKELFKIFFYNPEYYIKNKEGFNKFITYDFFDTFEKPIEFYIYAYIDCYGEDGRIVSDQDWTDLTGLSKPTIRKIISQMNSSECSTRIWKFSGDYIQDNNEPRQMINSYYTRPNSKIKKVWNSYYGNKDKVDQPEDISKKTKKNKNTNNKNTNKADNPF